MWRVVRWVEKDCRSGQVERQTKIYGKKKKGERSGKRRMERVVRRVGKDCSSGQEVRQRKIYGKGSVSVVVDEGRKKWEEENRET